MDDTACMGGYDSLETAEHLLFVEMHRSDKVQLQFGLPLDIPEEPSCMQKYHDMDLRRQPETSSALKFPKKFKCGKISIPPLKNEDSSGLTTHPNKSAESPTWL
ncbi:hypothetical protein MTR_7g082100 [Medicago truncatula]|uniref:Uncharacterized protein n=1 Tax=Medicago truncatula TaxID=3880 RepID=G7KUA0_MEDTR|nr:hypothetical protein MTR_7g082100 [Medicago truncatula]